jgi:hypothetical protein
MDSRFVASRLRKNDRRMLLTPLRRRESPTNRTEQVSPQNVILDHSILSFLAAGRESSESRVARLRNPKQRTAMPFVTMLQAAMPPVSYGCEVVLRTIRWILASRLTPLRKNDRGWTYTATQESPPVT